MLQNETMAARSKPTQQMSDTVSHRVQLPASSNSKDARALRSGQALRDALLSLLLKKPFDQITIRDICAEAGVHYATFFRHHQTKEALLEEIATEQIKQLNKLTLQIRGADDYQAGFRALFTYVDEHRSLWSTLLNGGAGAAMREEWVRQSQRVAENEKSVSSWLPTELGTVCAATLIAETIAWWVEQPKGAYSVEQVAEIQLRLLTSPLIVLE
jgi:AcrR family transcriptional regulator